MADISAPVAIGSLSQTELNAEIQKGVDPLKTGKAYTLEEVDAELAKEFGIGIPLEQELDVQNETTAAAIEEGQKMLSDPSAPRYSGMQNDIANKLELVEDPAEGGFVASYPDLPGCISCGDTIERAVANAQDAKKAWLEAALEAGTPIAEPDKI